MRKTIAPAIAAIAALFASTASAHEVYVLDHSEIETALRSPIPDFLGTISAHLGQFVLSGFLALAIIVGVFFFSIIKPLERALDPFFGKLKKWAPRIAQATLGSALLAGGYYHAIFGVELPLKTAFGSLDGAMAIVLMAVGAMLVLGVFPRIAALATTGIFVALLREYHVYMLNYATYVGEAFTISLFGGAYTLFRGTHPVFSLDKIISPRFQEYKFLIIRVLFGVSLIYASLYAKLFHGALALETVSKYGLTRFFPFEPTFLVLGAMLVEILIGLCFILGFETRFISVFFLVFLCLSVGFFGEAVWPHVILIGTAVSMFFHGYDRYSLSLLLERGREKMEPVL